MKEYVFEYFPEKIDILSKEWDYVTSAYLDNFNMCEDKNYPKTMVKGVYSDEGITVFFKTNEKNALARYKGKNEKPWTDSCVEIFFNPCPSSSENYFNFELSAGGGLLVGFGPDRHDRVRCDFSLEDFNIKTIVKKEGWAACFTIPFTFVLRYAEAFDSVFSGNFQKCGDETEVVHFPTWNKIESETPDFHRPECFGKFVLGDK